MAKNLVEMATDRKKAGHVSNLHLLKNDPRCCRLPLRLSGVTLERSWKMARARIPAFALLWQDHDTLKITLGCRCTQGFAACIAATFHQSSARFSSASTFALIRATNKTTQVGARQIQVHHTNSQGTPQGTQEEALVSASVLRTAQPLPSTVRTQPNTLHEGRVAWKRVGPRACVCACRSAHARAGARCQQTLW